MAVIAALKEHITGSGQKSGFVMIHHFFPLKSTALANFIVCLIFVSVVLSFWTICALTDSTVGAAANSCGLTKWNDDPTTPVTEHNFPVRTLQKPPKLQNVFEMIARPPHNPTTQRPNLGRWCVSAQVFCQMLTRKNEKQ